MRFMAIASVVCASVEMEPSDIAPVAKRLTMSAAGSTSSSGTGVQRPKRNSNRPRKVMCRRDWSLMICAYSLYVEYWSLRTACCSLATASGVHMCSSPRTRNAYSPPASSAPASTGSPPNAALWTRIASSAISNRPMPSMLEVVPVKYLSITARVRPTASKICAPVYDM